MFTAKYAVNGEDKTSQIQKIMRKLPFYNFFGVLYSIERNPIGPKIKWVPEKKLYH